MRHAFFLHVNHALLAASFFFGGTLRAAEPVFSGPQAGEKTTAFKTIAIMGTSDGTERDPIKDNAGAPTAMVFVHGLERSMAPLLRAIDEYGARRADRIKTEIIFLAADRISGEQKARAASGSLKLRSRLGFSPDGAEGPGNYGLNKECLMTVIVAKDNVVASNFALVQPGIADAPAIIAALAKTCGDDKPPTVESLMPAQPTAMRRGEMKEGADSGSKPKDPFPGAVPTDATLNSLLRQMISPTNDDATVNRLLGEMKTHVKDNADLKKQAADGWARVLHFGDHYGTAYSRKVGKEFMDSLQKP